MRVAVLSFDWTLHACARLRLLDPLRASGVDVEWLVADGGTRRSINAAGLEGADVVVVQRFFPHPRTSDLIDRLIESPTPLVYEFDDLITEIPPTNANAAAGAVCAPMIEHVIRGANAVVVSTPALARACAHIDTPAIILPNLVDTDRFPFQRRGGDPVTIGYSGTPTHAPDLALVEPVLVRIHERFGDRVRFWFQGCITPRLARLPGIQFVDVEPSYASYASALSASPLDLAIGPLEDNAFNRCKSAIKWMEYADCGIPSVFTDLAGYAAVIRDGETGRLVPNDPDVWYEVLVELILDQEARERLAVAARHDVEERHSLQLHAGTWGDAYRLIAAGRPSRLAAAPSVDVSIIVPVYGRVDLTRQCVDALLAHTAAEGVEVVVVDDASPDGTDAYLASLGDRIRVIRNRTNRGFAYSCNRGADAARGQRVVFLNNDTIPGAGWLAPLLRELDAATDVAIVGAKLLYPSGEVQHAGIAFGRPESVPYHMYRGAEADHPAVSRRRELRAITGACMLVRKGVFEAAGGFDEAYRNGFEDVDLCLRVREAGGRVIYQPESELVHLEEQTPGRKDHDTENLRRFLESWGSRLVPDETRLHLEDGWATRGDGRQRVTSPIASDEERQAWERVAETERRLEEGGPAMLRAHPPRLDAWPEDATTRAWGAGLFEEADLDEVAPLPMSQSRPLRILLVVHSYTTEWAGGTEIYTRALAHSLQKQGAEVTILHPIEASAGAQPRLERGRDGPVALARLHVAPEGTIWSDACNPAVERVFDSLLEAEPFDIVHFQHTHRLLPFSLLEVAQQRGSHVCVTLHDFWFMCRRTHLTPPAPERLCSGPDSGEKCARCLMSTIPEEATGERIADISQVLEARNAAARRALAASGLVTAPSRYVVDRYLAHRTARHIEVAPLGLEPVECGPRSSSVAVRFGFLGTITGLKCPGLLVEAFARVRGDATLSLHGAADAALLESLQRWIEASAGRARYVGPYAPQSLPGILAELDVLVVPSIAETYSLAAREALSAGLPVIASDGGALPEAIEHERNGFLFPSGDVEALAACMQRLIDDPDVLERLRAGITPPKTIADDAAEWLQRYQALLASGGPEKTPEHSELGSRALSALLDAV